MPRDGSATRALLLREAERLFARRGLYQVTVREIVEAAGQRNVSALTYHFGSREGVLEAILARHGEPTDAARRALFSRIGPDAPTRDLVATLVVPYTRHLHRPEGRDYLRIVVQLSARFGRWRDPGPATGPVLREVLGLLEARSPDLPPAVRRERVVGMIMLMTTSAAERARAVEDGRRPELGHEAFVGNLTDVLVGVLEAPLRGPVPRGLAAALSDV